MPIRNIINESPELPGVYSFKKNEEVLYVGKAKNLQNRLKNYLQQDLAYRTKLMVLLANNIECTITSSAEEALLLEAKLIKALQPKFNVLLKDDKSFPYIKFSKHDYPQITKYRGKKQDNKGLFGPFASNEYLDQALKQIQKIFKTRSCSDSYFNTRKRPCLLYQVQRCSAPCTSKISRENYQHSVQQAINFLSGKTKALQKCLEKEMLELSEKMQYEKAALIRDKIKAINYIQVQPNLKNVDAITIVKNIGHFCVQVSFYREGQNFGNKTYFFNENAEQSLQEVLSNFISQFYYSFPCPEYVLLNIKLEEDLETLIYQLHDTKTKIKYQKIESLEQNANFALNNYLKTSLKNDEILKELQNIFNLSKIPRRIEVYDNSHITGSFATGAMVVAIDGMLTKNQYRLFNINITQKGDDYQMLREVLTRRKKRICESNRPDLIIIDGGKAHLSVASKIIDDITTISMAKGKERSRGQETFYTLNKDQFTLDNTSKPMLFLQMLRNEVHNYAINGYRRKHAKSLTKSSLEKIDGIGKVKKLRLLTHFGSIQNIKAASIEELAAIPGINKRIAQKIQNDLSEKF